MIKVFAILYSLACPTCEPVMQAVYTTEDASRICNATAVAMTTKQERFYCDE